MRNFTLLLILIVLLATCRPAVVPTEPPTQSPVEIQTAAASTVSAIMETKAAKPLMPINTPDLTASPLPSEATVTPIVMATTRPTANFWVTYVSLSSLWISKSDGSMPTRLTNTPAQDFLPDWSPDGKSLAFLRFYGEDVLNGSLMVLPFDSNTPRLLTPNRQYTSFTWLPDSRTILAVSGNPPESFLIHIETGMEEKLTSLSGGHPILSPDGKKIAALVSETPCQGENCPQPNMVHIQNLETGEAASYKILDELLEWPVWSPDSWQLALHALGTDSTMRYILTQDGWGVAPYSLIDETAPWWATSLYAVSPDGTQVAYSTPTNLQGVTRIMLRPLEGYPIKKPIAKLTRADSSIYPKIDSIRWTPDGSGVVFSSWNILYYAPLEGSGHMELPVQLDKPWYDVFLGTASYSPPPEPTAPAAWHVCPGGLRSNLAVGVKAKVSSDPPTPNTVRAGPSTKNTRRGQIQPGEVVEILSGPECAEDMIWWEVRSPSTGLTGWTAEGTIGSYWLSPVE